MGSDLRTDEESKQSLYLQLNTIGVQWGVRNKLKIRDEESDDTFLVAHARGSDMLPLKKIKVAGVLKELKAKKEEKKASKRFLEAVYYLDIN